MSPEQPELCILVRRTNTNFDFHFEIFVLCFAYFRSTFLLVWGTHVQTYDSALHTHGVVALQHVERAADGLRKTAASLLASLCNCLLVCTLSCYACYVLVCHCNVTMSSLACSHPVTCLSVFVVVLFC